MMFLFTQKPRSQNTVTFPGSPTRAKMTVSISRNMFTELEVGGEVELWCIMVSTVPLGEMTGSMLQSSPLVFLRTQTSVVYLLHDL